MEMKPCHASHHQMRILVHRIAEDPVRFCFREIVDDRGMCLSSRRTGCKDFRSLDNSKSRCFQGVRLAFTATSQPWTIRIQAGCSTEVELVNFNRTGELIVLSDQ